MPVGQLISGGKHDLAVYRLQGPAALDESSSQIVEELRMRRTLTHHSEVARRVHDSTTEVMFPDPVHHHSRSQRVSHNRLGEFQPAATVCEGQRFSIGRTQDRRKST